MNCWQFREGLAAWYRMFYVTVFIMFIICHLCKLLLMFMSKWSSRQHTEYPNLEWIYTEKRKDILSWWNWVSLCSAPVLQLLVSSVFAWQTDPKCRCRKVIEGNAFHFIKNWSSDVFLCFVFSEFFRQLGVFYCGLKKKSLFLAKVSVSQLLVCSTVTQQY